jgi:FSR family fosmidomycin resistance protein-like MFS transporter
MVNANAAGGTSKPTTAMSVFFLFGQAGLAVGPMVAGFYLVRVGLAGMVYAAITTLPVVVMMFYWLRQPISEEGRPNQASANGAGRRSTAAFVVTLFILLIALRATTGQSFVTLLPKYYDDQGISPQIYGQMLGVFSFCGALGTFFGGMLGDRFNRRAVIFLSTVLCVPFCIGLLNAHGWLYILTAGLAGLLLSIPHSIVLVMAQQLLPTRKGMVGGLVLGFMFASGAVATWIAAWFADRYGLMAVLSVIAFLPLGAAFCALFLPSTRPVTRPLAEPKPAGAD